MCNVQQHPGHETSGAVLKECAAHTQFPAKCDGHQNQRKATCLGLYSSTQRASTPAIKKEEKKRKEERKKKKDHEIFGSEWAGGGSSQSTEVQLLVCEGGTAHPGPESSSCCCSVQGNRGVMERG